jgi:ribosomal protein S18 acetylase RimI-like enzyme
MGSASHVAHHPAPLIWRSRPQVEGEPDRIHDVVSKKKVSMKIKAKSTAGGEQLVIRVATRDDAETIGELARQFADYLRSLGDPTDFRFDAEAYLRDGFGPNPAFAGLVAELEGRVVGYLLYNFNYDTDKAIRLLQVLDLYVHDSARRHGTGRGLMQAAAKICRQAGGSELFWTVYSHNQLAFKFYESLGAQYAKDLQIMYWPT